MRKQKVKTIIITKKKTRRKSRSICNDKVTVKKKSRGALPILNHETGERG